MEEEEFEGEAGLLTLPDEVLRHVGFFLPLSGLLALSACCARLRAALNDNTLWRRHCRAPIARYLRQARGLVEPAFEPPAECGGSLEPLCAERVGLLRQNHMLANWRAGRSADREAATPGDGLFLENNDRQIVYGDVYLFLHTLDTNQIDVWNIEETPFLYTSAFFTVYEYDDEDDDGLGDAARVWYQIVGDKLVVIQGNLVQVFTIALPEKELALDYLIATDRERVATTFQQTLYSECYSWIVGHLLFSRLCFCPEVHVWDLSTGAKLRALGPPVAGWDLYVISLDDPRTVVFTVRTDDPYDARDDYANISSHVSSYDVARDEFTTLLPDLAGCKPVHAMQYGDFVVLFCIDDMFVFRCSIYVFERRTAAIVARATFADLVGLYKSRIIQDRLILATQRSVEILDAKSLEVVRSVKIEDTVDIDYLPVFDTTFIITSTLRKDVEVRDIDKDQVLMKIPPNSCVFLNESCSKLTMITGQQLVVKNFW